MSLWQYPARFGPVIPDEAAPDDMSWMPISEHSAPQIPGPQLFGYYFGDIHTGAAVVEDDMSWMPVVQAEIPRVPRPQLFPSVIDVPSGNDPSDDLNWATETHMIFREKVVQYQSLFWAIPDEAVGAVDDLTWLPPPVLPLPQARLPLATWWFGDLDSGPPDDMSWVQPVSQPLLTRGMRQDQWWFSDPTDVVAAVDDMSWLAPPVLPGPRPNTIYAGTFVFDDLNSGSVEPDDLTWLPPIDQPIIFPPVLPNTTWAFGDINSGAVVVVDDYTWHRTPDQPLVRHIPLPITDWFFTDAHTLGHGVVFANATLFHPTTFDAVVSHLHSFSATITHALAYCATVEHWNLMSGKIDIGDQVRMRVQFTDPNNVDAAIDPTTVTLKHKDPSGNVTTLVYGTDVEVIKESTGTYYADITIDEAGQWSYKWFGTGAAVAAEEEGFYVHEQRTA